MSNNQISIAETILVQRATQGDAIAFDQLADLHRSCLHNLAQRILHSREDAGDVVQDTLIKAFRAMPEFQPNRPLKPWLCRICVNCCRDQIRRRREGEPLEMHEYVLAASGNPEDEVAGNLEKSRIVSAIRRLPENYRRIIFMRHFRHMEVIEIARELNKPEGTVKSWLFRARTLLEKELAFAA